MKHSKEPWEIQHDNYLNRPCNIRSTKNGQLLGWTVSDFMGPSKEEADANAERIVACVNACAGITTEALESGLIKYLLNDAYMRTLNPFDPNPQNKMDVKYLGKPVYEEDFEEVENGKD